MKSENSAMPVRSSGSNRQALANTNLSESPSKLGHSDIESLIVKLNNDGFTQSVIGQKLKEEHGVKSVKGSIGKSVLQVLQEKKVSPDVPEDLKNLLRSAVSLLNHMKLNKADTVAKRGYQMTVSKIRSLSSYYKSKGKLPRDWVYTEEKAALLVK